MSFFSHIDHYYITSKISDTTAELISVQFQQPANTYVIYLLRLKEGRLYIGVTTNFARRYAQHVMKRGAKITKKYPPIGYKIIAIYPQSFGHDAISILENKITRYYRQIRGSKVFGGDYCGQKSQRNSFQRYSLCSNDTRYISVSKLNKRRQLKGLKAL